MNQIQHDELKEFEYTLWRAYQAFVNTNAMIMGKTEKTVWLICQNLLAQSSLPISSILGELLCK